MCGGVGGGVGLHQVLTRNLDPGMDTLAQAKSFSSSLCECICGHECANVCILSFQAIPKRGALARL